MPSRPDPVPDLDWSPERAAALGHRAVDMWAEFLARLPELPVDRGLHEKTVRDAVVFDPPPEPLSEDELFAHLNTVIFENSTYPGHPGFFAYISGAGTVPGAAADLVMSFLNQNAGGWRVGPAATEIELGLMRWLAARFGLPETAGGLVQSGGGMANFTALKAARDRQMGYEVRTGGVRDLAPATMYVSEEAHVVLTRAADMLGIGSDGARKVPVDDAFKMRVDAVEEMIRKDLEDGYRPIVLAATAGTTATGAIDPLSDLADVAERYGLWFHVDGAYGAAAVLSDALRPLLAGIERADSIVVDPHKWLYTPHSGGCVLLRDMSCLADSFGAQATYIHEDKDFTQRGLDLAMMGPQFSRGFHALKIWVSLLAHGTRAYGERIAHDAELNRYLAARVDEHPELELMTPPSLSICCFRYVPADVPSGSDREAYLDRLNERLMPVVQTEGRVYYSNAILNGRFVQRTCITNFRSEAEHMDQVVDVTVECGRRLHDEMKSA